MNQSAQIPHVPQKHWQHNLYPGNRNKSPWWNHCMCGCLPDSNANRLTWTHPEYMLNYMCLDQCTMFRNRCMMMAEYVMLHPVFHIPHHRTCVHIFLLVSCCSGRIHIPIPMYYNLAAQPYRPHKHDQKTGPNIPTHHQQ